MEYIAELRARHGDQIIARQQKRVLSPRIAADPIVCPVEPLTVILQNQTLFGPENIAHRTPTPAGSLDALGEVNGLVQATAPQTQTTFARRNKRQGCKLGFHRGCRLRHNMPHGTSGQLNAIVVAGARNEGRQAARRRQRRAHQRRRQLVGKRVAAAQFEPERDQLSKRKRLGHLKEQELGRADENAWRDLDERPAREGDRCSMLLNYRRVSGSLRTLDKHVHRRWTNVNARIA